MVDVVSHLRNAGFDDQEIGTYMQQTRDRLNAAGFDGREVDDYFGAPQTPANVPDALNGRLAAGTEARKREGGLIQTIPQFINLMSSPDGRTRLWNQVKQFPADFIEGLKLPGKVTAGEVDLSTPEGMDAAVGFGAMIGLTHAAPTGVARITIPLTRENAPGALRAGLQTARIERDGAGNITDAPVGGLPRGEDFSNAGRAIGNGDSTPLMEQKLSTLYQGYGLHPSEVAVDAARDPVVAQKILSLDTGDLPYDHLGESGYQFHGYEAEVPKKILDVAERMREAGIPASVQEPYFKDVIRGAKAKYENKFELPLKMDEGLPEYGIAPGTEFEVPKHLGTEQEMREKVLLEGKDMEYPKAQAQILSKISMEGETPTKTLTFDKLYTNLLDKFFPLKKEADLAELTPENNPYVLARLMAGRAGKADHFLNQGTFDFNTGRNNGPSLKQVLEPVADDVNGLNAYGAASRAIELEGRGIKSGFATESGNLDAARSVLIDGHAKYERTFRNAVDYQNRVLAYLRDSGIVSGGAFSQMIRLNKMMFPFARVMGYEEGKPLAPGGSLQARNPISRIKGSGRDIINPVESIIKNTYHLLDVAERNRVSEAAVKMLTEAGKAWPKSESLIKQTVTKRLETMEAIKEELRDSGIEDPNELATVLAHAAQPDEPGTISVMREGRRLTFETDPEIAASIKGLTADTANWVTKVLAGPASLLRAGAVLTPEFWGRHILRDLQYARLRGDISLLDYPRAALGLWIKDEMYWNWLKSGGGNVSVAALNRRYLQESLRKLTSETGLMSRTWNVMADPEASMWEKTTALPKAFQEISKYAIDPLRAATEFSENLSHFAAFRKAMTKTNQSLPAPENLREQITRAGWVSRDTAVDAARMGAAMKTYNSISAFGNIKVQDSDVIAGAIKRSPAKTLMKIALSITLPSIALWALNHDDPDYQELPEWQKDLFWIIPVGSEAPSPLHIRQAQERGVAPTNSALFFLRIPKPWATGLTFGSIPERLLDSYYSEKPEAFKDFFKNLFETVGPEFYPTATAPMIEQFANRSLYTNRTLIPRAQEHFLPEYQYTPYTTELTKQLGQILGAFPGMKELQLSDQPLLSPVSRAITSPILMENYIRAWTGTLGEYALNAADAALRNIGVLPDPVQPARKLSDIPFIRAFVSRYPSATTESVQNFYDRYQNNKSHFDTWIAKARDGDSIAMQHIQKMGGQPMFLQLDGVAKALSMQQKIVQDVYKNPNIQPDQKRQLIDQAYYSMIQTAQYGNKILDVGDRVLKGER
jgi:hypothetical protein